MSESVLIAFAVALQKARFRAKATVVPIKKAIAPNRARKS